MESEETERSQSHISLKLRKIIAESFGPRGESKFAAFVGIPRSTINSYTRGVHPVMPSFENMVSICRSMNVNLEWLFYDLGPMFVKPNFLDKLIASAIRRERTRRGLSAEAVSQAIREKAAVEMAADDIRQIESGARPITTDQITLFASIYGINFRALVPGAFPDEHEIVPIEEIARRQESLSSLQGRPRPGKDKLVIYENDLGEVDFKDYIPVLTKTPAGAVSFSTDAGYPPGIAEKFVYAPDVLDRNAYALFVEGDSMQPRYTEGDIIIASPNAPADFKASVPCVVIFSDDSHQFKLFRRTNGEFEILSLNKNYPGRIVSPEDLRAVHPVVGHIKPT